MTTPQPSEVTKPSTGMTRSRVALILLLGGVLALIGATQTWITASGFEAAHLQGVQLSGQESSPVITAMALVIIAAGAALSIAQRVGHWIISLVVIAGAIMMGATTLNVIFEPAQAVAQKIAEATGVTGMQNTTMTLETSMLPWLTLLGAALGLLGGILTLVYGSRWPNNKTKKYDVGSHNTRQDNQPLDEIDTWDELSRGEDPT